MIIKTLTHDDADVTYEKVFAENRFITTVKNARRLGNLAADWEITKNPYYIDLAILLCDEIKIEITPALQDCITKTAKQRMAGGTAGTLDEIKKGDAKEHTLIFMMNCIYVGDSLPIAASKAVTFHKKTYPELKSYTTLTLERYYRNEIRTPGIEKEYFKEWDALKKMDKNYRKETEDFVKTVDLSGEN